jgi:hypothetical protein
MGRFVWFGLFLLAWTGSLAAQGKLEAVRTTVYTPRPDAPEAKRCTEDGLSRLGDDEESLFDPFNDLFTTVGGVVFGVPFWVPATLWETLPDAPAFSSHPYGDGVGYLHTPQGAAGEKYAGLTLGVENGNDFSGLNRVALRGRADTSTRWGITTQWDFFREKLDCGCVDQAVFGDLMLTYRFVQAEHIQMHAGLGVRGFFDDDRTRGGLNFSYAAEVFPVKPWVLGAQVEVGHLHRSFTSRLRGTMGAQWKHVECFGGYDWFRIGGVDLHGPMLGLRLWY